MPLSRQLPALVVALLTLPAIAADPPKPPAATSGHQRVVRLISSSADVPAGFGFGRRGPGGGGAGGPPVRLTVSNDMRRRLASVAGAKGELVTVTFAPPARPGAAPDTIDSIAKFDGDKALADPRAYTVDGAGRQTIGTQSYLTLKVSKFGQAKELLVPNRPATAGAPAQPDPALAARVQSFKPGEIIEIETAPGPGKNTQVVVDAWRRAEPVTATFVKLAVAKDAENKPVQQVVVETAGKQAAYALPTTPAGAPPRIAQAAAAVQAAARRLKPGYTVRLTVREEAPAAAPAPAASLDTTPAPATPATPAVAANDDPGKPRPGESRAEWERRRYGSPAAAPAPATPAAGTTPAATAGAAPVLRDLQPDGRLETPDEKSLYVHSTFVRIEFAEPRRRGRFGGFGGGGGGFGAGAPQDAADTGDNLRVTYHAESATADDAALVSGIERALASEPDAVKAGISIEQAKQLSALVNPFKNARPTGPEQAQWLAAHAAWRSAPTDDARHKVEQDMLLAAQELSLRWRKEYAAVDAQAAKLLKPAQVETLRQLGKEPPARGPGFGGPGGAPPK